MTTRQIIVQDDGSEVAPHPHDATEISGQAEFITVRVDRLLAGTINGKEIIVSGGTDGIIRSDNFVEGSDGWRILGDGTLEANNAIIRNALINLPSGTSFPGSPSDGDLFYRTDENKAYRYDGTSWHALDFIDDANRVGSSVIATAAIQDLAVETAKINDLAVTTAKINDLAVSTAKIANAAIDTAKIADAAITNAKINDLSAGKITAGSLDTDRLSAGSIFTEKLVVGSSDNLISNPGFEAGTDIQVAVDPHVYVDGGEGSWEARTDAGGKRSGSRAAKFSFSTTQTQGVKITFNGAATSKEAHPSAAEGDVFYAEGYARLDGSAPNLSPYLRFSWRGEDGTEVSGASVRWATLTTAFAKVELEATAPAGVAYVVLECGWFSGDGNVLNDGAVFDDLYMRRKVGTLVIENQAVDIERMLDPVHMESADTGANNQTITTTNTEFLTHNFTIPSWVGILEVVTNTRCQMSEAPGGTNQNFTVGGEIGGTLGSNTQQQVHTNELASAAAEGRRKITSPGSTVEAALWARTSTATNTTNELDLVAFVIGVR